MPLPKELPRGSEKDVHNWGKYKSIPKYKNMQPGSRLLKTSSVQIMGNKIYTYELTRDYAARIDNLRSYDVVSKDVIHRWVYPFVLDTKFGNRPVQVKLGRTNIYKEEGQGRSFVLFFK
jgi:hypothetical protein